MLFLQNIIWDDNLPLASQIKRSGTLIDDMNVKINFDLEGFKEITLRTKKSAQFKIKMNLERFAIF